MATPQQQTQNTYSSSLSFPGRSSTGDLLGGLTGPAMGLLGGFLSSKYPGLSRATPLVGMAGNIGGQLLRGGNISDILKSSSTIGGLGGLAGSLLGGNKYGSVASPIGNTIGQIIGGANPINAIAGGIPGLVLGGIGSLLKGRAGEVMRPFSTGLSTATPFISNALTAPIANLGSNLGLWSGSSAAQAIGNAATAAGAAGAAPTLGAAGGGLGATAAAIAPLLSYLSFIWSDFSAGKKEQKAEDRAYAELSTRAKNRLDEFKRTYGGLTNDQLVAEANRIRQAKGIANPTKPLEMINAGNSLGTQFNVADIQDPRDRYLYEIATAMGYQPKWSYQGNWDQELAGQYGGADSGGGGVTMTPAPGGKWALNEGLYTPGENEIYQYYQVNPGYYTPGIAPKYGPYHEALDAQALYLSKFTPAMQKILDGMAIDRVRATDERLWSQLAGTA